MPLQTPSSSCGSTAAACQAESEDGASAKEEENSKRPALTQPEDTSSAEAIAQKFEGEEYSLESLAPDEKRRFIAAESRRKCALRSVIAANSKLLGVQNHLHSVQSELKKAKIAYDGSIALSQKHFQQDVDILMFDPSEWNRNYLRLKAYFDQKGHSNIKRKISEVDTKPSSFEQDQTETQALLDWACRQRKLKRRGELEHSKEMLLNRLRLDCNSETGHGNDSEEWLQNYNILREFKEKYGHVEVMQQGENSIGQWVNTQLALYRNCMEGKLPALSAERIHMLEELGMTWDEIPISIPWESEFQRISVYKEQFGHTDVPREWEENTGLAQWVINQREKFRDRKDGKENDLNDEQISRLNSIGFQWGVFKDHCSADSPTNQQSKKIAGTTNAEPDERLKSAATSYPHVVLSNEKSPSAVASQVHNPNASFSSKFHTVIRANAHQVKAQAGEMYNGISSATTLNSHANANQQNMLDSTSQQSMISQALHQQLLHQNLFNSGFGTTNQYSVLGSTSQQAMLSQALHQQVLNQQLMQQQSIINAIGAHQASMHAHQQLSCNQQLNQSLIHNVALQGPQIALPYQLYQQLLAQQTNESCPRKNGSCGRNNESDSSPQDKK